MDFYNYKKQYAVFYNQQHLLKKKKKKSTILQQDFSTGFHIFMADCPEISKLKTSSSKIIYMWEYLGFPNTAKTINILSNPQTHNRSMFARVQFVIPHLEIVVLSCDFFHFCICICGLLPRNRGPVNCLLQ